MHSSTIIVVQCVASVRRCRHMVRMDLGAVCVSIFVQKSEYNRHYKRLFRVVSRRDLVTETEK